MAADLTALNSLVRASPMTWMEMHATILGLKREFITYPALKANFIQKKEEEVLDWMRDHGIPGRVIKLKGRRQGSSTGTLARFAHRCRQARTNCLVVSLDKEKNGKVMRNMFDRFVELDRFDWGVTYNRPAGTFSNGSQVVHMSANTVTSGRGDGFQRVLLTEAAYYPSTPERDADDLIVAIFQCVPREPDTEIVMESTPKGEGGKFHNTWKNAVHFDALRAGKTPANWNGFVKIFYPWHEHPDYTRPCSAEEASEINSTLSERETELLEQFPATVDFGRLKWRREVLTGADFEGDEDKFEVEYPSDEFTCFAGTGRKQFPWRSIKAMMDRATPGECGTLEWVGGNDEKAVFIPCPEKEAWIRVWEKPIHGCSYSLVVDPMTGEQAKGGDDTDNHAIGVWRELYVDGNGRVHNRKLVARITDCGGELKARTEWAPFCQWYLDVLTERLARAARMWQAILVVEMNKDIGIVERVKLLFPWIVFYMREEFNRTTQETSERIGWMTNPHGTGQRSAIIESLTVAVRNWYKEGGVDIPCRRVLHEMSRFIVKESGRAEAGSGAHDDTVMMSAIALATLGKAMPYFAPVAQLGPRRPEVVPDSSYY